MFSTCFVKIVDDGDSESGLLILACVYDDVFFEILSTCFVRFVDDDDSQSYFLILTCVYDDDVLSMLIFCDEEFLFSSSNLYRSSCFFVTLLRV